MLGNFSEKLELGSRGLAFFSYEFVADALAFVQVGNASLIQRTDVHEYVAATLFRLNEAEAFCRVEPLNNTSSHKKSFLLWTFMNRQTYGGSRACTQGRYLETHELMSGRSKKIFGIILIYRAH